MLPAADDVRTVNQAAAMLRSLAEAAQRSSARPLNDGNELDEVLQRVGLIGGSADAWVPDAYIPQPPLPRRFWRTGFEGGLGSETTPGQADSGAVEVRSPGSRAALRPMAEALARAGLSWT
jgi:hypothetical protein